MMDWTYKSPDKVGIYAFAREYEGVSGAMKYAAPRIIKVFKSHFGTLMTELDRGVYVQPCNLIGLWHELPELPK